MKKIALATTVALGLSALPALAADMKVKARPVAPPPAPSMFDIAFGGAIASDYNFRGVSQSDRGFSPYAYFEPRFKPNDVIELYVGLAGYGTKLPTTPTAEIDLYGGIRLTAGSVVFDVGGIYYYYPNETQVFLTGPFPSPAIYAPTPFPWTKADTDFGEVYGKVTWTANEYITVGGYAYYSPDLLNTGADGLYFGGTVKLTGPAGIIHKDVGTYLSGELAYYALGTTDAFFGNIDLPDYGYWNVGIGFTYKALTFDLRYHDTSLTRAECFTFTGDLGGLPGGKGPLGGSNWCSEAIIGKISFDTTLAALK